MHECFTEATTTLPSHPSSPLQPRRVWLVLVAQGISIHYTARRTPLANSEIIIVLLRSPATVLPNIQHFLSRQIWAGIEAAPARQVVGR